MIFYLFLLSLLFASPAWAEPEIPLEPQVPFGAVWRMTLEQVERLPALERTGKGALQGTYTVRGSSQIELVARWQGRAVSFYFAHGFGLYAIAIEMVPQTIRHSQAAADQDLLDLEQCAPVRRTILSKYGPPKGLVASWDTQEITPIPELQQALDSSEWHFARNFLLWQGQDTRLALSEQSVWYVSQDGLSYKEQQRKTLLKEGELSSAREADRQAKRQRQLDEARKAIPARAPEFESVF